MRNSVPKGSVVPQHVLVARAREMLATPTAAEELLFRELRGGRLGVVFRRQVPLLGRYVADFVAEEARLVVEVDGGYHACRRATDARRDEALRRAGWRVVRVEARVVERELGRAVEFLREALRAG